MVGLVFPAVIQDIHLKSAAEMAYYGQHLAPQRAFSAPLSKNSLDEIKVDVCC